MDTNDIDTGTTLPPTAFPPKRSWLQRAVPWLLVILSSLVIGFLLALFLLYIPAARDCREQQADLAYAEQSLALREVEVTDLQSELEITQQLAQTEQDNLKIEQQNLSQELEKAQTDLVNAQFNLLLAKLGTNTAYARLALSIGDTLTAQQEMSTAADNLKLLKPYFEGSQVFTVLETRLEGIRAAIPDDLVQAINGLEMFNENLLRIETR